MSTTTQWTATVYLEDDEPVTRAVREPGPRRLVEHRHGRVLDEAGDGLAVEVGADGAVRHPALHRAAQAVARGIECGADELAVRAAHGEGRTDPDVLDRGPQGRAEQRDFQCRACGVACPAAVCEQ